MTDGLRKNLTEREAGQARHVYPIVAGPLKPRVDVMLQTESRWQWRANTFTQRHSTWKGGSRPSCVMVAAKMAIGVDNTAQVRRGPDVRVRRHLIAAVSHRRHSSKAPDP